MTSSRYLDLKRRLLDLGYGEEIAWAANIQPCASADDFTREHAFVVCNSGMRAQVARKIFDRVWLAVERGESASTVFGHRGKAQAIDAVWSDRSALFETFTSCSSDEERLFVCAQLPWIGAITKWHLAKNLGMDCCKPDRHLVRVAAVSGETPSALCERLSTETGDRVALVDLIVWRAANLRLV